MIQNKKRKRNEEQVRKKPMTILDIQKNLLNLASSSIRDMIIPFITRDVRLMDDTWERILISGPTNRFLVCLFDKHFHFNFNHDKRLFV